MSSGDAVTCISTCSRSTTSKPMFSGAGADRPFGVPPAPHAAYVTRTPIRRPRCSDPLTIPTRELDAGQRSPSVLVRQLSHFITC